MKSIGSLFFVLLILGCSPLTVPSIETERHQSFDFSSLKTFSFVKQENFSPESVGGKYLQNLQQSIQSALEDKGYLYIESAADFTVLSRLNVENKVITIEDTAYLKRNLRSADGKPFSVNIQEGALFLAFFDDASNTAIFTGTAKTQINKANSSETRMKLIDNAVRTIIDDFPQAN